MNFTFEQNADRMMLVKKTTDEKLVDKSKALYKMLKKETRTHKKPIRYSHVETAQYEKMGNLFNVFAEQVKDWRFNFSAERISGRMITFRLLFYISFIIDRYELESYTSMEWYND